MLATPPEKVTPEIKVEFRKRAEEILNLDALGFGEMTAEHMSLPLMKAGGLNHFHSVTKSDHPLLLLLANIAAEKDVPINKVAFRHPWAHRCGTDRATCGQQPRSHGADLLGEGARWEDPQDGCGRGQKLTR